MKYLDPDGSQAAPPMVLPRVIPWTIPVPIPSEVCPLPLYINPRMDFGEGQYYIERPWNGDWNHAPNGPDMKDPNSNPLGDDWEPDKNSNSKDPTGQHKKFINKRTGETVRWDENNGKQEGHWHRLNPDKTTNKKLPYLDKNGRPCKKDSPKGHIKPNPIYIYAGPLFT